MGQFYSETWVIYYPIFLGMDVFCDWPFLGWSSKASLATTAKILVFLKVAIFEGKLLSSGEEKKFTSIFIQLGRITRL